MSAEGETCMNTQAGQGKTGIHLLSSRPQHSGGIWPPNSMSLRAQRGNLKIIYPSKLPQLLNCSTFSAFGGRPSASTAANQLTQNSTLKTQNPSVRFLCSLLPSLLSLLLWHSGYIIPTTSCELLHPKSPNPSKGNSSIALAKEDSTTFNFTL